MSKKLIEYYQAEQQVKYLHLLLDADNLLQQLQTLKGVVTASSKN